jgi:hypothetical protein
MSETRSDSDLRQGLLGTWRLVSAQTDVDGTLVNLLGDNPLLETTEAGTSLGFLRVIWCTHPTGTSARDRPQLFGRGQRGGSPVPVQAYCGTFEVRDGQVASGHIEWERVH